MISHKYKCIFIHIPKCAGSTVKSYLSNYAKAPSPEKTPVFPRLSRPHLPPVWTRGLAKVINLFPDYFTFTFVRNPFDRLLSAYHFELRCRKNKNLPAARRPVAYRDFREFVAVIAELLETQAGLPEMQRVENVFFRKDAAEAGVAEVKRIGPHQTPLRHLTHESFHSRPQVDYLLDRHPQTYFGVKRFNDAPCSFIGRCETFERDFFRLTDLLGVPRRPLTRRNFSKERLDDSGQKKHYSAYYDKTTRRLVEDLYAEDLQALGYEFEDESAVSVPAPLYDVETARASRKKSGIPWWRRFEVYARRAGFILGKIRRAVKRRCKKSWFGTKP